MWKWRQRCLSQLLKDTWRKALLYLRVPFLIAKQSSYIDALLLESTGSWYLHWYRLINNPIIYEQHFLRDPVPEAWLIYTAALQTGSTIGSTFTNEEAPGFLVCILGAGQRSLLEKNTPSL